MYHFVLLGKSPKGKQNRQWQLKPPVLWLQLHQGCQQPSPRVTEDTTNTNVVSRKLKKQADTKHPLYWKLCLL